MAVRPIREGRGAIGRKKRRGGLLYVPGVLGAQVHRDLPATIDASRQMTFRSAPMPMTSRETFVRFSGRNRVAQSHAGENGTP